MERSFSWHNDTDSLIHLCIDSYTGEKLHSTLLVNNSFSVTVMNYTFHCEFFNVVLSQFLYIMPSNGEIEMFWCILQGINYWANFWLLDKNTIFI